MPPFAPAQTRRSAAIAALAAAGLAGLLLAIPSLQLAMKAVGTAYLLWLAWQTARSGPPHLTSRTAEPSSFVGGIELLWVNPKGWAMTFGAAASFAPLANGPTRLGLLLGATFGVFAAFSLSLRCAAGLLLARTLRTEAQWRTLNIALGVLLAASILPMWR